MAGVAVVSRKRKEYPTISLYSLPGPSPRAINVLQMQGGFARIEGCNPVRCTTRLLEVFESRRRLRLSGFNCAVDPAAKPAAEAKPPIAARAFAHRALPGIVAIVA